MWWKLILGALVLIVVLDEMHIVMPKTLIVCTLALGMLAMLIGLANCHGMKEDIEELERLDEKTRRQLDDMKRRLP